MTHDEDVQEIIDHVARFDRKAAKRLQAQRHLFRPNPIGLLTGFLCRQSEEGKDYWIDVIVRTGA